MTARFQDRGNMLGHSAQVTSICTSRENNDMILSSSRDKTVMSWSLIRQPDAYGVPRRSLHGHNHFVNDVVISSDGQFALSGSWDSTLRLWEINTGVTSRRFVGHKKDVLSVAFSVDNRQIVSGSRDCSIKLWNTLGQCKYTMTDSPHTEWVSCVRFSPKADDPTVVSGGWDKLVKVWSLTTGRLKYNLAGHTGYVNSVTVSPDGSLCASGGKDGTARLWDLKDGRELYTLNNNSEINSLAFSPSHYWLCTATNDAVKVWNLETKQVIEELKPTFGPGVAINEGKPRCTSLAWSGDGTTLFAGYSNGAINAWNVL